MEDEPNDPEYNPSCERIRCQQPDSEQNGTKFRYGYIHCQQDVDEKVTATTGDESCGSGREENSDLLS